MKRRVCQRFSQGSRLFQGALALFVALTFITISHRGNAAAATFNGSGFTIADSGTVATPTISVSGLSGGITNVSITLSFGPASRPDDLDLLLVHPNGTNNLEFMSDAGANGSFTGTVTLATSGATCVPNSSALANGTTYRPSDYAQTEAASVWGLAITISHAGSGCSGGNGSVTFAQAFNGLPPNGTWTLYARDDVISGTSSTVTSWSITITTTTPPTAAGVEAFTATSGADGRTALRWRTGYEVDNLGFKLYREQGGQRVPLTPSLIAGSALLAGSGTALTAGRSYAWWDDLSPGTGDVLYWLEDIDLSGRHTLHGPVAIDYSVPPGPSPPTGDGLAPLLSNLGRTAARQTSTLPVERYASGKTPRGVSSARQALLAAQPAVKLFVGQEGWYRVTQPELLAAGLNPGVDPRRLQLYVDGREVPIRVTGQKDGRLDAVDAVEFYGVGLDKPWTNMRVYWLVVGGRLGQRIALVSALGGQPAGSSFPYRVERKDRSVYFSALRNGEQENFFGAVVSSEPAAASLQVLHLDPVPPGTPLLEVSLQGVTQGAHRTQVTLNGVSVGEVIFQDQDAGVNSFPLAPSWLREGDNEVELVAQAGEDNISLVNTIHLTYWHTYTADADALRFSATGGQQVTIGGFSSTAIRVLDITEADAVQEVSGVVTPQDARFAVTLTVPGSGARTLLAFTAAQANPVAAVTANRPSRWRQSGHGADLLIISHRNFMNSIEPLQAQRQSQGLRVAVVDVEDIYDEFGFGDTTPYAIRDFLSYAATHWALAPRFVLLVGDASFDSKNYLGFGQHNFVPTKLIDTQLMETASDTWLADFDNNGLAEMMVGRLPVRTVEDADRLVAKIVDYTQSGAGSGVLLVADRNDGEFDFAAVHEALWELIPPTVPVEEIDRGQMDAAVAKSQLLASLNRGPLLVNYSGHASVDLWRGNLLTADDAAQLTNGERLSVFVTMTCLNGYFHDAALESLAEALLNTEHGGAVAVWAPSGMTEPGNQAIMNQELYRGLFPEGAASAEPPRLGEAIARAQETTSEDDIRRTWILLGDPTMQLRFP